MVDHFVRDESGRPILPGDILKVFHFVGARRKRYYMYKQAVGYVPHPTGAIYLKVSHLNRLNDEPWEIGTNFFWESADQKRRLGWEIVDSINGDHAGRLKDCGASPSSKDNGGET